MKGSFMKLKILGLIFIFSPLTVQAFSEDFLKDMAHIQSEVMLKGNTVVSKGDMEKAWNRFDAEILNLINSKGKWSENELNGETKRKPLSITLKGNGEMEEIELGSIEVKFYDIEKGDAANPVWIAALVNDMEGIVANTFHVYMRPPAEKRKKSKKNAEEGGLALSQYELVAAFENISGPWQFGDSESLMTMNIQIQKLWERSKPGSLQFATYHSPFVWKKRTMEEVNRQQILWQLSGKELKPLLWFPEVDWHITEGKRFDGRGEGILPENESEKKRRKR